MESQSRVVDLVLGGGELALAITRAIMLDRHNQSRAARPDIHVLFHKQRYVDDAREGDFSHFFPKPANGYPVFPDVTYSTIEDLTDHVSHADAFIAGYPTQESRTILTELFRQHPDIFRHAQLLTVSKGMTPDGKLPYETLADVASEVLRVRREAALLVGANLAAEIFNGTPVTGTIAGESETVAHFTNLFRNSEIITRESSEPRIIALAVALKNVHAIAAGVARGIYGEHADSIIASIVVAAKLELEKLAEAFGARDMSRKHWFDIEADYILSLTGKTRNFKHGVKLARGEQPSEELVEGVATAPIILAIAEEHSVQMPIVKLVCQVISGKVTPQKAAVILRKLVERKSH